LKTRLLQYILPIIIFLSLLGQRSQAGTISIIQGLNTTANITQGSIIYGQYDIKLFAFGVKSTGGATNITTFNIQCTANANQIFSNAKLYRATLPDFSDSVKVTTGSLSFPGSYCQMVSLNETIPNNTTVYYLLVADFTGNNAPASTLKFNMTNSTNPPNVATNPYATFGYTTTDGQLFTIGFVYNWKGKQNNDLTDKRNYNNLLNQDVTTAPGPNDIIRIGVVSYQYPNYQPSITSAKSYKGLVFGSNNSPILTIAQGITLNITGGMTINAGATPTIASSSTSSVATLKVAGTSTVASTGNLQLSNKITVNNTGAFTFLSDASGTGSLGALPSTASLTGTYTVQRWFTGGQLSNRGWRLMSSPVANGSGTYNFSSLQTNLYITGALGGGFDVSPANNATVLLYDTANKKFISLPSITTGVNVGSGFYFYFRGNKTNTLGKLSKNGANYTAPESNVVGLQTGTLNQQGITYTLSNAGSGFNLVGNPYASTISMPSGGGSVGNSAPYTGTTGFVYTYTPGANSVSPAPSTVNIASGQGFYVKSTSSTSSIAFTESLKTATQVTGSNLLLGKPVGTGLPILSVKMVQDSANYDIAHIRFLDTYKNEYDEMEDADDIAGSGQSVFLSAMTIDAHAVAIASQPLDKKRTSIFLNVNDNYSGLYSIQKMDLSGIPEVYDVWLMDHFKSDSLDLRANNTYKFNLDKANPLTFGSTRFEIVIRKKALPPYELVSFNGQKTGTDVLLKWNTVNEYDYTSFELQRSTDGTNFEAVRNIQSSSQGSYNFKDIYSSNNTATIYYRLKQVDINDMVYYSNIVIITPAKGNGTFAVFPNPATNTIQFNLDQTIKLSSVRLNIFNAMGLLMKSSVFTASTGQQDVSNLIPGNYTIEVTDLNSKKAVLTGKFIKL
jgi:hypothetical protein